MWLKQCLFALFLLQSLRCDGTTRQLLNGNDWIISNVDGNYTTKGTVPGTIHTNLYRSGLIPDPYLGFNDIGLRYLVYDNWIFTKNFSLSSDMLSLDELELVIDQIDTVSNITLNGCPIGSTNSMFIQYRFELPRGCVKPTNQIQIDFQSPVIYAYNQSQIYNDTVPPLCPPETQHGECHVQFIRKEPCSFSWDWGPAFAPIGIPGDISIEGCNVSNPNVILESVNLATYDSSNQMWRVDVILSSENNYTFVTHLKFMLLNTTWSYATNVTMNRTVSLSLNIPDSLVLRWWPNGYGNQNLYQLAVSTDDVNIGSRMLGFRTVELVQKSYGSIINGTSFYFRINNQTIFVKGSNWIPSDAFQESVSDEKLEILLRSAALAHMNMLRIWGGGIYERNSFYDLADEIGIMLWHDFMFACSLYPVNVEFLNTVQKEVSYQVKRLQHHASIVLWSGNNENEAAVAQNWYAVPPEKMEQVKNDYRTLYVDTVMTTVAMVDQGNNRPFITSSPTNGLESIKENYIAKNPQDPLYGDVHFYGYGNDSWDWRTYPITRFLSETGIQSLPSLDAWLEVAINQSDLYFESPFVLHREHSGNQITAMMYHIESNLPTPQTNDSLRRFTQLIYLSQINQAMTLKSIGDFCRMHSSEAMIDPKTSEGDTMGLMYWQINDIWQAPTWSTIEYGLKWKMGHYYVRHMYEPVNVLLNLSPYLASPTDESAQVSIYVVNDLFERVQGQLTCSIIGTDRFTTRLSWIYSIDLAASTLEHINDLPYALLMRRSNCQGTNPCLFHCSFQFTNQYNQTRQINQTLFFDRPKSYALANPKIQIGGIKQFSPVDYEITLTASMPALFVWLDITGQNQTGYFSRNGFHMFEESTVVDLHFWKPLTKIDETPNFDLRITSLYDVLLP